jgi:asparagine synthase (glutamine-hydrolysing)
MCGIAGIADFAGNPIAGERVVVMTDVLAHRGPDGGDLWLEADRSVALGHRRLSILDIGEGGRQPMRSHNGRFVLSYNGEIYNFLEVRAELAALGHRFTSESDSEVILAAFVEWGEAMLPKLNGMWALAIYDTSARRLFLARDRFGVKPLYYSWANKRLSFASEIRALRAIGAGATVDADVARRLLIDPMRVEGSTRTLYADITRLQGGHFAWVDAHGVAVTRWWRTLDHLIVPPASAEARGEHFRELFYDAIRLRMRSDVAVGTCLSGGFDSSAITCAMAQSADPGAARQAAAWQHAFVASFPGWRFDERASAEEAATFAGITPSILEIRPENGLADIDNILADLDDIYIDPAIGPWMIYREVRRAGVTVTLDGHGADELMGAYRPAGGSLKFTLQGLVANAASRSDAARDIADRVRQAVLQAQGNAFLRPGPVPRLSLVGDDDALPANWGSLSRSLYAMFHSTILPTLLRNFDRMAMAHGIEVRMPFMDWRLVAYVMSLPDDEKFGDGYTKLIARKAMAGRMPESIRSTKLKLGFNSPMAEYLAGPLADWTRDLMATSCPQFDAIVDSPRLAATIARLTSRNEWTFARSQRLWPYIAMKKQLLSQP